MLWSVVLRGRRWWFDPDSVVHGSGFVVKTGSDVYWLLKRFVNGELGKVHILGIDAPAGHGKSVAGVRLAVDLSYDGWLVIIAFHSHELGRKLFEYGLRYAFVRAGLIGKWHKKIKLDPLILPRIIYVGGMDRYCPFYNIVADGCRDNDKTCYVVRHMLKKAGVPEVMWGKSVKYLIEHKILNAKEFCNHCPFMRENGRLRQIPQDYWPDSRSWFGPRILYTKDVADLVEKYLFPLMYRYDSMRGGWRRKLLSRYIKMVDPRVGVCPRRLLLKPIFSKKHRRKSDDKVVFYNFWIYHGGMVVLAPFLIWKLRKRKEKTWAFLFLLLVCFQLKLLNLRNFQRQVLLLTLNHCTKGFVFLFLLLKLSVLLMHLLLGFFLALQNLFQFLILFLIILKQVVKKP